MGFPELTGEAKQINAPGKKEKNHMTAVEDRFWPSVKNWIQP